MKTAYRVEWMHNGNWRMDINNADTFSTRELAEKHEKIVKEANPGIQTRIVEVGNGSAR